MSIIKTNVDNSSITRGVQTTTVITLDLADTDLSLADDSQGRLEIDVLGFGVNDLTSAESAWQQHYTVQYSCKGGSLSLSGDLAAKDAKVDLALVTASSSFATSGTALSVNATGVTGQTIKWDVAIHGVTQVPTA